MHKNVMMMCRDYVMANGVRFFKTNIPLSIQFVSAVAFEEKPMTIAQPASEHASFYFELVEEIMSDKIKK